MEEPSRDQAARSSIQIDGAANSADFASIGAGTGSIDNSISSSQSTPNTNNVNSSNSSNHNSNHNSNPSQRTKLSSHDVKLILYLITQVQPFKYVGNRLLTQNKKWENIQEKFMIHKQAESSSDQSISPPTIRTLQRQLAAATRKAIGARHERRKKGITTNIFDKVRSTDSLDDDEDDEQHVQHLIDQHIRLDCSTAELEAAVLKLSELSESMKAGRVGHNSGIQYPQEEVIAIQDEDEDNAIATAMAATAEAEANVIDSSNYMHGSSSLHFSIQNTIDKISEIELHVQRTARANPSFKAIKKLLRESLSIQQSLEHENARLIQETEALIRKQEAYTDKVIEFNRTHSDIHERVNKNILRSVVASLLKEGDVLDGKVEEMDGTVDREGDELQRYLISLRNELRS